MQRLRRWNSLPLWAAIAWVAIPVGIGVLAFLAAEGWWSLYCYPDRGKDISLGDVFNGFLLGVAILAGVLAWRQLRESASTAKATFVKDLYTQMFADADIRDAFYLVEYGKFSWSPATRGSAEERKMDRLLAFANLVCDLRKRGSISSSDMDLFDYEFVRVHRDDNVQDYMSELQAWYGEGAEPFASFCQYCRKRERDKHRPSIPAGEKWATNSLGLNLARMKRVAAMIAGGDLADRAESAALHEPRLKARLGAISTDVRRYPISTFLGELVGKLSRAHADQPADGFIQSLYRFFRSGKKAVPVVKTITQVAVPFAEWQYGTYALERGIDDVGWERMGCLLKEAPELAADVVEAVWSVGLLLIARLDVEAGHEADVIRSAQQNAGCAETLRGVASRTRQYINELATGSWDVPQPPTVWDRHRQRLWANAVVMARARFDSEEAGGDEALEVFTALLRHVADDGPWPLSHPANDTFAASAPLAVEFQSTVPEPPVTPALPVGTTIEFLSDPLEVLNIGNAFGTCLRLAREGDEEETRSILGWATNVNIRVIAVVDANRALLARQTLGLCTRPPAGVLFGPIYPPDCSTELQEAIAAYREGFLHQTGLTQVTAQEHPEGVEMTCAKAYNGGWL